MWERIAYKRRQLPQVYDLTCFDEQGEEIDKRGRQYHELSRDIDREVQFREQAKRIGANTYQVHLMSHKEVWQKIREEEGSLLDQYIGFVAKTIGLDEALHTLPAIMRQQETISPRV